MCAFVHLSEIKNNQDLFMLLGSMNNVNKNIKTVGEGYSIKLTPNSDERKGARMRFEMHNE